MGRTTLTGDLAAGSSYAGEKVLRNALMRQIETAAEQQGSLKQMVMHKISTKISYIESSDNPLSADIGIIEDQNLLWLYDVGNDKRRLSSLTGKYNVVLSHFHANHIGNLDQLDVERLYVSKFTFDRVGKGSIVEKDLFLGNLHIFPLPSSHTKGCLGLEIDGEYAFIGDAIYSKANAKYYIYNSQLLKEEIEVLKNLRAKYLLVSHFKGMVMEKAAVIQELEAIYSGRDSSSSEILVKKNG